MAWKIQNYDPVQVFTLWIGFEGCFAPNRTDLISGEPGKTFDKWKRVYNDKTSIYE